MFGSRRLSTTESKLSITIKLIHPVGGSSFRFPRADRRGPMRGYVSDKTGSLRPRQQACIFKFKRLPALA